MEEQSITEQDAHQPDAEESEASSQPAQPAQLDDDAATPSIHSHASSKVTTRKSSKKKTRHKEGKATTRKAASGDAPPSWVSTSIPPWVLPALIITAGVGLSAAAVRGLWAVVRRSRSRRRQHTHAFVRRFHMEASQPASSLLEGGRLVVDARYDGGCAALGMLAACLVVHHAPCVGGKHIHTSTRMCVCRCLYCHYHVYIASNTQQHTTPNPALKSVRMCGPL